MLTYAYAYYSYKKGKLRVYLIYKLKVLKVSGAHAPLGPTVDTPLANSYYSPVLTIMLGDHHHHLVANKL